MMDLLLVTAGTSALRLLRNTLPPCWLDYNWLNKIDHFPGRFKSRFLDKLYDYKSCWRRRIFGSVSQSSPRVQGTFGVAGPSIWSST